MNNHSLPARPTMPEEEMAIALEVSKENKLSQEILMQCIIENWTHARHVEMEKLYFTSMYAVVIGAILTSLVSLKGSLNINLNLFNALIYFSMLFTALGLMLAVKWSRVFEEHIQLAKKTAKALDTELLDYINLPNSFKDKTNSSTSFRPSALLRTKYMFYYFYISIFIMLIVLLST